MAKIEKTLSTTKPTTVTGAAQPTRRKSCPATSARKPRNVKCVVSVSMLTEGWDANMVTHVLGVRALGTQLRCEQVVGRGLRRMSYQAEPCTLALPDGSVANFEAFPVAYAEVCGVPFSFIPSAGSSSDPKPGPIPTRVRALADRQQACEIQFPRIDGYRYVAQIVVSGGAMRPGGDRSSGKTDAGLASTPPLAGVMG
jgi:hypothetical protein